MPDETQTETFTIELDKEQAQDHSANAATVASTIQAFNSLIQRVHDECEKDRKFLVKVRPFAKGSLEIPLELVLFVGAMLLNESPFFERVRKILHEFIGLKISMGSHSFEVKEGNIVLIQDSQVVVDPLTLEMLQPQSEQNRLWIQAFREADKEKTLRAIHISSSTQTKPIVSIGREDFSVLAQDLPGDQVSGTTETSSREHVIIRSVSFDSNLSWHFKWREKPISAKVLDVGFKKRIEGGEEAFTCGDKLEVELHRIQVLDPKTKVYLGRDFTIIKVYDHIRAQEQGQLFET